MDQDIETLKSNPSRVTPLGVVQLLNEIQYLRDLVRESDPQNVPPFDTLTLTVQQAGDQQTKF